MPDKQNRLPGLAATRRACGLTQRQLADAVGVDRVTIACYESGRYSPSLATLKKIARILGTTVGALIGETVIPAASPRSARRRPLRAVLEQPEADVPAQGAA